MLIMTKKEFLSRLRRRLRRLPTAELRERIGFYSEIIDDKIEEGLSEAEAVAEAGNIDEIADQISEDIADASDGGKQRREVSAWQIVLLIVGSPVWLPILISVFVVIWSVVLAIWAVEIPLYIIAFISKYLYIACIACAKIAAVLTRKCAVGVARLFRG
jgi:uncharacterized membrane protein